MCLIVHKPAGVEFPAEILTSALARNANGFGVWTHRGNERFSKVYRTMRTNEAEKLLNQFVVSKGCTEREAVFHFRKTTKGDSILDNVHPYQLRLPREWGRWWLMHNGTFSRVVRGKGESDTAAFGRHLSKMARRLRVNGDMLSDKLWDFLDQFGVLDNQRVLLMNDKEVFWVTPETDGVYWKGCWFSNTYAWNSPTELRPATSSASPRSYKPYNPGSDFYPSYDNGGRSWMDHRPAGISRLPAPANDTLPRKCFACTRGDSTHSVLYRFYDMDTNRMVWGCVTHVPANRPLTSLVTNYEFDRRKRGEYGRPRITQG